MASKRTLALDVTPEVRAAVYKRDSFGYPPYPCCVVCGKAGQHDIAHYISRAHGGLAILKNLVNLCRYCHSVMDQGKPYQREIIRKEVKEYLQYRHKNWDEEKLIYKRE